MVPLFEDTPLPFGAPALCTHRRDGHCTRIGIAAVTVGYRITFARRPLSLQARHAVSDADSQKRQADPCFSRIACRWRCCHDRDCDGECALVYREGTRCRTARTECFDRSDVGDERLRNEVLPGRSYALVCIHLVHAHRPTAQHRRRWRSEPSKLGIGRAPQRRRGYAGCDRTHPRCIGVWLAMARVDG